MRVELVCTKNGKFRCEDCEHYTGPTLLLLEQGVNLNFCKLILGEHKDMTDYLPSIIYKRTSRRKTKCFDSKDKDKNCLKINKTISIECTNITRYETRLDDSIKSNCPIKIKKIVTLRGRCPYYEFVDEHHQIRNTSNRCTYGQVKGYTLCTHYTYSDDCPLIEKSMKHLGGPGVKIKCQDCEYGEMILFMSGSEKFLKCSRCKSITKCITEHNHCLDCGNEIDIDKLRCDVCRNIRNKWRFLEVLGLSDEL